MSDKIMSKGKSLLYFAIPYLNLFLMFLLYQADVESSRLYINTKVRFYTFLLAICFGLGIYYIIKVNLNIKLNKIIASFNAVVFTILWLYARFSKGSLQIISVIMSNEIIMLILVVILILNTINALLHHTSVHSSFVSKSD